MKNNYPRSLSFYRKKASFKWDKRVSGGFNNKKHIKNKLLTQWRCWRDTLDKFAVDI